MFSMIEYLKRPELVVAVQEWFGVEYLDNFEKQHDSDNKFYDCNEFIEKTNDCVRQVKHHQRNDSDESVDNKKFNDNDPNSDAAKCFRINNKFWYYLFLIGTELGDEIFYATMIPFWFWNIDGAVGRRVVFVWSIVMYIGQGLKDIIRWPRPPMRIRLQTKWSVEYGMPSTHAMVAVAMPFSVVIYMLDRYQYSAMSGFLLASIWCSVICLSRIYLGMHSVADVIAGILLTISLMLPLIPLVDKMDHLIMASTYSPIFVIGISILLIVYYPRSDKYTPTRGDTTMTTSVLTGILVAAWLNYQTGALQPPEITSARPYQIIWPTYNLIGLMILRTVLGLCCVIATRAIGKSIAYAFVCMLLGRDKNEVKASESTLENRDKIIVELSYKFFVCFLIGFITNYLMPNVFKMLRLGRPDFYTEI